LLNSHAFIVPYLTQYKKNQSLYLPLSFVNIKRGRNNSNLF